jgi:hypothetical protein
LAASPNSFSSSESEFDFEMSYRKWVSIFFYNF